MATPGTLTWLETYAQAGAALSFAIEGFPIVFSTDAMPGTYSADAAPYNAFADPSPGLMVRGALDQQIQLYAQDISAGTFEFTVSDREGVLAAALFREGYATGHRTYLTSSIRAGATGAINVKSTTGFAASGTIYIGDEAITYTSTTATSFGGTITRGKFAINQTSIGGAFSAAHTIGNNVVTSATTAPAVTDYPKTWYGRFVHIFMHVRDPLTRQYNLPSAAYKAFTGKIMTYRDEGDGKITIVAKSAIDLLNRAVGSEQWTARFNEGVRLTADDDTLLLVNTAAPAYNLTASLGFTGATQKSHSDVAAAIQAQFEVWRAAASTHAGDLWDIALCDFADGNPPRYRIRITANTTAVTPPNYPAIGLHKDVWSLLGYERRGGHELIVATTHELVVHRILSPVSNNLWQIIADQPPIVYLNLDIGVNASVYASSQIGTFTPQTVAEMGTSYAPRINGFVQIRGGAYDGGIYAVGFTAGSPDARIEFFGQYNPTTGLFKFPTQLEDNQRGPVRLGDAQQPPIIKQIWFEHGSAATIILKALLSTGGDSGGPAGYNHPTYDAFMAPGLGIGVPASLVDIPSFEALRDISVAFIVNEPRPFYKYLEPVLQVSNRYIVWKAPNSTTQPKLSIVRPATDGSAIVTWVLNESNKCLGRNGPDRVRVERAAEGVINRVVVKYGYSLDGASGGPAMTWIVEDVASQSDYGKRRTVTIEAPGVVNVPQIAPAAIAPALAYFSRPLAVAERSYNASCMRMAPGDSVSVTDNYMIDPQTGTRGAVIYGWVLACQFDLATGQGKARIVFLPEKVPRLAKFAPSAKVVSYNAGTKTLTVEAHAYSNAGAALTDAQYFANLDRVHIYSLDEAVPLEWNDIVNGGPGLTTIVLTTGLAGFDPAKTYVIEFDDVLTVQSTQKNTYAFIADDADLSTGGAPPTPYDWGSGFATIFTSTPVYSVGMFQPNTSYDDKGEPASVHKFRYLAHAANNAHSYKTRQIYINQYLQTAATQNATTPKILFIAYVPIYGHIAHAGTRNFIFRLYASVSGGSATFTIRASPIRPLGTSFTTATFPHGSTSVDFNTSSTSLVWSPEGVLTGTASPAPAQGGMHGTWITVEGAASAPNTATLRGIFVAEDVLS